MPNLVLLPPVEIFSWPPASISGLILNAIGAFLFFDEAISESISNSEIDSILNCITSESRAKDSSFFVFPTPEKTIFFP